MSQSGFWDIDVPVILSVTNQISLVSSIATFLLMSALRYYRPYIFNRVSLRFQGFLAFIDIIRHALLLGLAQPENSGLCVAISFLGFYFDHLYILANAIIALNLQLIFFHNIRPDRRIEMLLLGGGILAVSILDSVPFMYGFYGRSLRGTCFVSSEAEYKSFFKTLLLCVVQLAGMMYCFCIFISVFVYLCYRKKNIEMKFPNKTIILFGERVNARDFIEKLYRRIAFYPMASVVCFFPFILGSIITTNGFEGGWKSFIVRFGIRFAGTANFIALMFDPHLQFAVKDILKKGLNYSHISKKELQTDADFNMVEELKEDYECLVELPGKENIRFKDFIIFV